MGQLSGRNGTVRGSSSRNVVHDTGDGYGLNVIGGSDDPFAPGSPGGSFASVDWTSTDDRFVNNGFGIAAWGGHRHANIFGPSKGNDVRLKVVSPRFANSGLRDVDILGSSAYETLPANAEDATTFGAGNSVRVTLVKADFEPRPGRVWIKNQDTDAPTSGRFDTPIPKMDPTPSYRNKATITGSRRAFERTNPGANQGLRQIPAAYFAGGNQ